MTKLSRAAKETQRKTDRLVRSKGHSPKQQIATDYNFAIMQLAGALATVNGPKVREAILSEPLNSAVRTRRAMCIMNLEGIISSLKANSKENLKALYALNGIKE